MKESASKIYLALLSVQLLFGINFATSKTIVKTLDPFIWSNIRFLTAGVLLLGITLLSKRPHPKLDKKFLAPIIPLSLLGMALGQGLFLVGLKKTTSVNTAIITTSIPLLTLLIVVLRKQESFSLGKGAGFVLAMLGVVMLRNPSDFHMGSETLVGDALVFIGCLSFALYLSFGKKFLFSFDNLWVTTWMFLISGIFMTILNIPKWMDFTAPDIDSVFIMCASYTIIGATLLSYFLNNWALKRAPSGNVALFIYTQPIIAGLIGWNFLGEEITGRMVICSFLILGGMCLSMFAARKTP